MVEKMFVLIWMNASTEVHCAEADLWEQAIKNETAS